MFTLKQFFLDITEQSMGQISVKKKSIVVELIVHLYVMYIKKLKRCFTFITCKFCSFS